MDPRIGLATLVRWVHSKEWAPGTGGNFAVVMEREPLRLLITPSGWDKGEITPESLLLIDREAAVIEGDGKPSAESLLHVTLAEETGAEVILHGHSVWNNLASLRHEHEVRLSGFEMLKGLSGVTSHEHEEIIPILDNSQDIGALAHELRSALTPGTHAVLLRAHGVYTWGSSPAEAKRHMEVLEFLFELTGRLGRTQS